MAGVAGFEPANSGVKVRCVTSSPYPSILYYLALITKVSARSSIIPMIDTVIDLFRISRFLLNIDMAEWEGFEPSHDY